MRKILASLAVIGALALAGCSTAQPAHHATVQDCIKWMTAADQDQGGGDLSASWIQQRCVELKSEWTQEKYDDFAKEYEPTDG